MKAKKFVSILLMTSLLSGSVAAVAESTVEGTAKGFGGEIAAKVTLDGEKITGVELTGDQETPSIGGAAWKPSRSRFLLRRARRLMAWRARL